VQAVRMEFANGSRVRVRRDPQFGPGPWPAEPTGRVVGAPEEVQGREGTLRTYWVEFDEPQLDTDGDGPYYKSQVLEKYLEAVVE
jgi:hypothetical protein